MAIPINPSKNRNAVTAYIHMYTQIYAHMYIIVYCKGNLFSMNKLISCKYYTMYNRAGGNSPAALVLAGPGFLKVKMKFNFYKKQLIDRKKRHIKIDRKIIDRKGISRGARLSAAHTFCLQGILLCKKLSIKHHGSVIFRPVRLITVYYY